MPVRVCRFTLLYVTACVFLTAAMPAAAGPCTDHTDVPGIFVPSRSCFELGIGYQYQHFNVLGTSFHNHDYVMDADMHLLTWSSGASARVTLGVEGTASAGVGGNTGGSRPLKVKSLFLGAGPRIAVESDSRFEPWIHGLRGGGASEIHPNGHLGQQFSSRLHGWRRRGHQTGSSALLALSGRLPGDRFSIFAAIELLDGVRYYSPLLSRDEVRPAAVLRTMLSLRCRLVLAFVRNFRRFPPGNSS